MTPETNHDTEISIYHDFLEDQGIIVDRTPEDQDQWIYESKFYTDVGGGVVGGGVGVGVGGVGSFVGGSFVGVIVGVGGGCDGVSTSKRIGG